MNLDTLYHTIPIHHVLMIMHRMYDMKLKKCFPFDFWKGFASIKIQIFQRVSQFFDKFFFAKIMSLFIFIFLTFYQGYGWLTIQIRNIRAYGLTDGSSCDVTASSVCDPYVKLFINNEKVIQTKPIENLCCLDANVTYQSIKIPKKSSLKIEVWDDDSGFFGSADDLVQSSEGSIDSFIKTPIRSGAVFATHQNLIETIVFWQDEL